ncbi:MAG: sigma 54-interacting transcriptional regulator, partial [Terriglobia bacterium]
MKSRERDHAHSFDLNGRAIPEEVIFGQTPAMRMVQHTVQRVASASAPVLILGESGTGKEIVAKEI